MSLSKDYKIGIKCELSSKRLDRNMWRKSSKGSLVIKKASAFVALFAVIGICMSSVSAQQVEADEFVPDYKERLEGESEFDNQSELYIKDWRNALSKDQYEDTQFGVRMYNEASIPTKLEVLRLLSKDTPSMLVFLTAVSMGLDVENVLQASVQYDPEKSRDLAASAVSILPVLSEPQNYLYSSYEIEDLEREDEEDPYSVEEVVERFFDNRAVLRPYPDWIEGQYHFLASAAELKRFQDPTKELRWYRGKTTDESAERPIFVSLYEGTQSVLIDGIERVNEALRKDPDARLPVVFVFNRLNERSIDELGYPLTIRGVRDAYTEKQLMVTPAPEWQMGDYHFYASMDEVYEVFDIPEEEDFEPEAWDRLVAEAEDYSVTNTSFIAVIMGAGDDDANENDVARRVGGLFDVATWDDPRTEEAFPYVKPKGGPALTLENILGQGIILNRPDLIAALSTLGVNRIPIAFYYVDNSRVAPYLKSPRALIQAAW